MIALGSKAHLSVDPELIDAVGHLAESSPLVDSGAPSLLDPDGSPSDMGAWGGPGADGWDLDGDGYPAWCRTRPCTRGVGAENPSIQPTAARSFPSGIPGRPPRSWVRASPGEAIRLDRQHGGRAPHRQGWRAVGRPNLRSRLNLGPCEKRSMTRCSFRRSSSIRQLVGPGEPAPCPRAAICTMITRSVAALSGAER